MLVVSMGIAQTLVQSAQAERAVEILSAIQQHASSFTEIQEQAQNNLADLEAVLSNEIYQTVRKKGLDRKPDIIVEEIFLKKEK